MDSLEAFERASAKLNPQVKVGNAGFWASYNVCGEKGPIKEMGRVFWVVDNFGNLVMTNAATMSIFYGSS